MVVGKSEIDMAKSWSLDKTMMEKQELVSAKASALGIPESEAFRLCVLEYELGIPMSEYNQQAENAYNVYKTEAPRPGTSANDELKRKMANELALADCYAEQRAINLKLKADRSVEERMIDVVGEEQYQKGIRSLEAFEADPTSAGYKSPGIRLPKFPTFGLEGVGETGKSIKRSLQVTGAVLIGVLLLVVYIVFVKGKGAEGVSVSAVGK